MGMANKPRPVKLICGLLAQRGEWLDEAVHRLEKSLGPVDLESDTWPFDFTDYYEEEMGGDLLRRFCSFKELIDPANLVIIKHTTNRMEQALSRDLKNIPERPVNLDPGYVNTGKLVLATTKDYSHRVYLRGGMYAEVTLRWKDDEFKPWEWTYPDYRTGEYREFFARVRAAYMDELGLE